MVRRSPATAQMIKTQNGISLAPAGSHEKTSNIIVVASVVRWTRWVILSLVAAQGLKVDFHLILRDSSKTQGLFRPLPSTNPIPHPPTHIHTHTHTHKNTHN